jgi:hypothetical protein
MGCEFIIDRNEPELQETKFLAPTLERFGGEDGTILRCHAKGAMYVRPNTASRQWCWAAYETCLNFPELNERLMCEAHCCGPFRSIVEFRGSQFNFAASIYSLKCFELFRLDWRGRIDQTFFGVESFPGWVFDLSESACRFADRRLTMHLKDNDDLRDFIANCIFAIHPCVRWMKRGTNLQMGTQSVRLDSWLHLDCCPCRNT